MFKNIAIALLVAAVSAQDAEFMDEAVNSSDVTAYGEAAPAQDFSLGQGEGEAKPKQLTKKGKKSHKKVKKSASTSDFGGSFVTPKIRGPNPKAAAAVDYKVPNFGVDFDIKATQKHIKDTEKKFKHKWTPKKKTKSFAVDYKVPNFGLDKDILDANASIKSTEKKLKKQWNPTQDADGMWVVPVPFDNTSYSYKGKK